MRPMLLILLLVPLAAPALHSAEHDAVVGPVGAARIESACRASATTPLRALVGTLDTIGGTVYDWQLNGPAYRMLVTSPAYGMHTCWMFSSDPGNYVDRNMRYNFYDFSVRDWNWVDPDFMQSGINTFSARSGFGSLSADPVTGVAMVSCHQGTMYPVVARDVVPGAGIFEYCDGRPNIDMYEWPVVGVTQNGMSHLHMLDYASQDAVYYSRTTTWCNWASPMGVASPLPNPTFPDQNIAASRVSNKVTLTWVYDNASSPVSTGYTRTSTDGGVTWAAPAELVAPDAFGGDTVTSFHITSLFPWYDSGDTLHIVANFAPVVHDTVYVVPAVICHWTAARGWREVHRAEARSIAASVGYNAMYACRPTIGEDGSGNLLVAWEQFDSLNVEPVTNLLRADIFAAGSVDRGGTWSPPRKLTSAGTASCRFPCISDRALPGDSLFAVIYEVDRQAGFIIQGQGTATENPIVVQLVPIDSVLSRSQYHGRVITPNGGQVLRHGDTLSVNWTVEPKDFFYGVLSFSTDGGVTYPTVIRTSIPPPETTSRWQVVGANSSRCRVKFTAVDSFGIIVFSDASDANFAVDSDTPGTPGIVHPRPDTAINNPSVVFRWRSVPDTGGIDYYTVQVARDTGFQVMVDTARRSDTTLARTLAPDTCYFWRVRATDRVGFVGRWSQPARFEIDARTPGVPVPLEPASDTWLRTPAVAFGWTEVQLGPFSPVRYVLSVDTQAVGIDLWVDTTQVACDTLVLPWQRGYWWQVRAFDRAGNQGAVSAPRMFGVDTTRPPTPVLVFPPDSGTVGRDTVSLIWRSVADNASGLRFYHVQVARDTGFVDTLAVPSPVPLDTVRHVTLSGGVDFNWRVRAIDRAGHVGLWSPRRSFALVVGLAWQGHGTAGQLRLPTHVRSSVRLPDGWRARMLDVAGRLVAELAPGSNDVRYVEPGVYFIRAEGTTGRATAKVVLTE